jgi:hypothetical protein
VLVAGLAYASYQTLVAPSGTGSATPVNALPLTLDVTGTVSTDLYPGGPGASVTITVANPYARPISVTALTTAGDVVVTPLSGRTCATTGITVQAPDSGLPLTVGANATSASVTLPAVVKMGTSADSGCQGATFTIPFKVTGQL